jgi:hypothetical protein
MSIERETSASSGDTRFAPRRLTAEIQADRAINHYAFLER